MTTNRWVYCVREKESKESVGNRMSSSVYLWHLLLQLSFVFTEFLWKKAGNQTGSAEETKNLEGFDKRKSGSQMKQDQDSIYTGFTTAVAAAVFAIHSIEQAETLKNKNGNKKEDAPTKLRFSFKKKKNGGETYMKQKQNHEALERTYSNRKPSPSPSHEPKIHEDNPGKADRIQNDKLKTVLAWAKAKKMKVKHKMEKKKD